LADSFAFIKTFFFVKDSPILSSKEAISKDKIIHPTCPIDYFTVPQRGLISKHLIQ
jgi:hypothetical protein